MAGKIVLKTELSAIMGVTPKTIGIWQAEGMPHTQATSTGKGNLYNTAEIIAWYVRRQTKSGLDVNEERAKLAEAQTEAANLRNLERKGELIPLEDAIEVAGRAAGAIRQKIINSNLSEGDKQALLVDINSLKGVDFAATPKDDAEEAEEPEAGE